MFLKLATEDGGKQY